MCIVSDGEGGRKGVLGHAFGPTRTQEPEVLRHVHVGARPASCLAWSVRAKQVPFSPSQSGRVVSITTQRTQEMHFRAHIFRIYNP